jgi:type II secretory pathway pseudopilin PulG
MNPETPGGQAYPNRDKVDSEPESNPDHSSKPASNPEHGGVTHSDSKKKKRTPFTFVGLLVVVAILGILVAMLLPVRRSAGEASRRMHCSSRIRQIGIALRDYEFKYGSLPPAYTVAADGTKLHSWRVLILPFLRRSTLYNQLDLTKPWNDPFNQRIANSQPMPGCYRCSSAKRSQPLTSYAAVVDKDSCIIGERGRLVSEVTDKPSETILVTELGPDRAIHWMEPCDLSLEEFIENFRRTPSFHYRGGHVVMLDGSIRFLSSETDEACLGALTTIAADDRADFDDMD